jgi:Excreted virulence factor EspC, type VII ESX diderm
MGGYGDVIVNAQQNLLDQEATQAAQDAAVRREDAAKLPSVPKFRATPPHLHAFPAHAGSGGEFHVYTDQLTSVSSAMDGDVNTMGDGLGKLNGEGPMGQLLGGGWTQGDNLSANLGMAYDAISSFMQELQTNYSSMAKALHTTAQNYNESDSASAAAANGVASGLG